MTRAKSYLTFAAMMTIFISQAALGADEQVALGADENDSHHPAWEKGFRDCLKMCFPQDGFQVGRIDAVFGPSALASDAKEAVFRLVCKKPVDPDQQAIALQTLKERLEGVKLNEERNARREAAVHANRARTFSDGK
jgi:hypothetical protein